MLRIQLQYLTSSKAGTVEIYPTARFRALYVGRDAGCDVRFDAEQDTLVSRNHAVIEWQLPDDAPPRFSVSDLLSSNGTFVNGERIGEEAATLKPGDHLRFGLGGPEVIFTVDVVESTTQDGDPMPFRPSKTSQMPAIDLGDALVRARARQKDSATADDNAVQPRKPSANKSANS